MHFRRFRQGTAILLAQDGVITIMTEMITMVIEKETGMPIQSHDLLGVATVEARLKNQMQGWIV